VRGKSVTIPWPCTSVLGTIRDAIQSCDAEKALTLLPQVTNVNERDAAGVTLLHYACADPVLEVAVWLLKAGADPRSADDGGFTPLHCAAAHGLHDIIRALIAAGADVNARSIVHGFVPLHEADDPDTVAVLVSAGATIDARDEDGNTPLHRATWNKVVGVPEALIERGANPWAVNNQGLSPKDDPPDDWWDWLRDEMKKW
jgi:ankyrin repeat protein